ncbi:MAG TPA: Gfo/Idh/MocA family oxidoreductase [Bacillales bacterium]|nr:Gfo/Idh/MocA family oxidoreductase [Bacillales bacterium]
MRVYIIGAGVIGHTHAEACRKLPEPVELRVADINKAALKKFAERFPEAKPFSDAEAMLAAEAAREDDVVIAATPPAAHAAAAKLGFASGRHVLCEKPLAMNVSEAKEMVRAAEAAGRWLGCCSVRFKGMRHMETVKRVIASGALGDVYHVTFVNKWERSRAGIEYQPESRWFLDSAKSGGGVLMDWGPYDFATLDDMLRPERVEVNAAWTAKPVTAADPQDTPFDVETHVGAVMTFYRETKPVHVHYERATCAHGEGYVRAEIEGTKGSVSWTPFDSRQPVFRRYDEDGKLVVEELDTGPKSEFTIMDNPMLHFYNKIHGITAEANINEKALKLFEVIRALYDAEKTCEKQTITFAEGAVR